MYVCVYIYISLSLSLYIYIYRSAGAVIGATVGAAVGQRAAHARMLRTPSYTTPRRNMLRCIFPFEVSCRRLNESTLRRLCANECKLRLPMIPSHPGGHHGRHRARHLHAGSLHPHRRHGRRCGRPRRGSHRGQQRGIRRGRHQRLHRRPLPCRDHVLHTLRRLQGLSIYLALSRSSLYLSNSVSL